MTIFLPSLAVAFAAFCVWLTVRIVNRKERWAKRLAFGLVAGLPVLYVASFGPACWFVTRLDDDESREMFHYAYRPLLEVIIQLPEGMDGLIECYSGLGAPADSKPYVFRFGRACGFAWNRPGYSYTALSR